MIARLPYLVEHGGSHEPERRGEPAEAARVTVDELSARDDARSVRVTVKDLRRAARLAIAAEYASLLVGLSIGRHDPHPRYLHRLARRGRIQGELYRLLSWVHYRETAVAS